MYSYGKTQTNKEHFIIVLNNPNENTGTILFYVVTECLILFHTLPN